MYTVNKAHIPYDLRNDKRLTQKRLQTITYGPKVWNTMPFEINNAISLQDFKNRLKTSDGPCDCAKWN